VTDEQLRCPQSVHDGGRWPSFHKCGRPIHEDGLCKIHCPSAIAARAAKSQAAWDAKQAASPYRAIERLNAQNKALSKALASVLPGASQTYISPDAAESNEVAAARALLSNKEPTL